jgi:N-acetylglutamate synthase-like GNAT family acetyltransferase
MARIEIIDTNAATIRDHGFCGIRNAAHEGHKRKTDWLRKRFAEGLKFKILQVDGVDAGMIEYIPGEHTWRPVEAANYMVIHCIMIDRRRFKGKGYGALLVDDCVAHAKAARMAGVAVVTSSDTWMAGANLFLRCGFECVDTAPPAFELLATKLKKGPSPKFRTGWEATLRKYGSGLTILKSDQCPCIVKCTADILDACRALRIRPKVVQLRTDSEARNAPSAYGIFNVIYNGQLVAEHPIGGTRFLNIMRKLSK